MEIKRKCTNCGKVITISNISMQQLSDINAGIGLIQDILPNHTPDEREMFISNICTDCWNEIFNDEDIDDNDFFDNFVEDDLPF